MAATRHIVRGSVPLLLLPLLLHLMACGADGRTWTSSNGKFTIDAEMIGLADGKLKLKKANGRVIDVPLAKLTEADQAYAKEHAAKKQAAETGDADTAPSDPPGDAVPSNGKKPIVVPPRPDNDADEKEKPKTGYFKITNKEGVSAVTHLNLMRAFEFSIKPESEQAVRSGKVKTYQNFDGTDCNWQVYVPKDYDGKTPYGLFVFISSGDVGSVKPSMKPILNKHRFIWIGANKSGNSHDTAMRHSLALQAVTEIKSRYRIDPERVYVGGFSGGGRVSSQVMVMHPDIFRGGMPVCGCNPYRTVRSKDGGFYEPRIKHLDLRAMALAQKRSRMVFFTGETDNNRAQTKIVANLYKNDGFRFVTYLEVPGQGHTWPPADWFEKGLNALDAPLAAAAKGELTNATAMEKRGKFGAAVAAYTRGIAHGPQGPETDAAKAKLAVLRSKYEEDVLAMETVFAEGDIRAAKKSLIKFRKIWGQIATSDGIRFQTALKEHGKKSD